MNEFSAIWTFFSVKAFQTLTCKATIDETKWTKKPESTRRLRCAMENIMARHNCTCKSEPRIEEIVALKAFVVTDKKENVDLPAIADELPF